MPERPRTIAAKADFNVAEAKFFASNAAWEAADRAPCRFFGGRGWSELYRVGRHLQDVRVCRIYEGTDEIMKLKIAAALLGKDFCRVSLSMRRIREIRCGTEIPIASGERLGEG